MFLPHLEPKLKLFEVDDIGDDIYIMVKCLSVCLSRKMIIVCMFIMFMVLQGSFMVFYGFWLVSMVFRGSFMVFGWFQWFFKVVSWFLVGFHGFSR